MKTYDDIFMEDLLSDNRKRALEILRQLIIDKSLSCIITVASFATVYRQKDSGKIFVSFTWGDSHPLTEIEDVELELQQLAGLYLFKNPRNDDFRIRGKDLEKYYEEIPSPKFKQH